ncbi:MAG: hypothetical protein OHK0029_23540 [Armatimonadaceae bacterium]
MSYQNAEWSWHTELPEAPSDGKGVDKQLAYRLLRPNAARDFPLKVQDEVLDYCHEMLEARVQYANAPLEKIEVAAKQYPNLPEIGNLLDKRGRLKGQAFVSLFPRHSDRKKLFQSSEKRQIPRSSWTPEVERYVAGELELMRSVNPGQPISEPEYIAFHFSPMPSHIMPSLWIGIPGIGAVPVLGGVQSDKLWRERIAARWLCRGDSTNDPTKEAVKIIPLTKPVPPAVPSVIPQLPVPEGPPNPLNNLARLHRDTGIPIFARLEECDYNLPVGTPPATVGKFVETVRESKMMAKWRDGALLVSYEGWLRIAVEREPLVAPWQPIQQFWDAVLSDREEAPTLAALVQLTSSLSEPQMKAIGRYRYNPVGTLSYDTIFHDALLHCRPALAEMGRLPRLLEELQSPQGVPLRHLPEPIQLWANASLGQDRTPNISLRIVTEETPPGRAELVNELRGEWKVTPLSEREWTRMRRWRFLLVKRDSPDQVLYEHPITWGIHQRTVSKK